MYTNPLMPLTGFGLTAGAFAISGFPLAVVAIFAVIASFLAGYAIVRGRDKKRAVR